MCVLCVLHSTFAFCFRHSHFAFDIRIDLVKLVHLLHYISWVSVLANASSERLCDVAHMSDLLRNSFRNFANCLRAALSVADSEVKSLAIAFVRSVATNVVAPGLADRYRMIYRVRHSIGSIGIVWKHYRRDIVT